MVPARSLGADAVPVAARHRRQHAADAGARAAERSGLVRSAPVPDEPAGRVQHPLEPPRRSADRGDDPAVPPILRRALCRETGLRHRAAAAAVDRDARACRHRAAASQPAGVAAGDRVPAVLPGDHADVHARTHRPSRLATCDAESDGGRPVRPERAARGADRRPRQRGVADDRAGDAAILRRRGRHHRAALGVGSRRGAAHGDLCAKPVGRLRARLCRVRLLREQRTALRRADTGMAVGDDRRGRLAVPARAGLPAKPCGAAGDGDRRRAGDRRRLRAGIPAMPRPARTGSRPNWRGPGSPMFARPSRSTSIRSATRSPSSRCRSSA